MRYRISSGNAGKDGVFLSFLKGIHSGSRDDQAAAHYEVRQIADESGRGTLYAQLQQYLHEFHHDTGYGTEGKGTD